jgi:GNAT superfamily N-acetyltransferase
MALDQRGSRWFGLPACTTSPEGLPPSLAQHRFVLATFYVTTTLLSWTHDVVKYLTCPADKRSAMPRIRMLTPDDRAALASLTTRVSLRTSYARFHGVVRVLTTPTLNRLLDLEHGRHEAVIAETGEGIVAVARYVRDTPTSAEAEAAIVVADAWQRAGVGRKLTQELATAAWHAGIRRFRATMMLENGSVRQFVTALAPTARGRIVDGKLVVIIDLPDPSPADGSTCRVPSMSSIA